MTQKIKHGISSPDCNCGVVLCYENFYGETEMSDIEIEHCSLHNGEQNAEMLKALRTLVNSLPVPEIELARSAWGNTNTACVLEARAKAAEEIAKVEGKT